jgi:hypothetical protein
MDSVSDFISKYEGSQKAIMFLLHKMIADLPGIEPKIKFGIPFYYRNSWICYLNPINNNGIELAFTRGNELSDEQGILDFKGRKQICGITFHSFDEIDGKAVREIIQEAILLDETTPYRSPGKRK